MTKIGAMLEDSLSRVSLQLFGSFATRDIYLRDMCVPGLIDNDSAIKMATIGERRPFFSAMLSFIRSSMYRP